MRNVLDKGCREKKKTRILCPITFSRKLHRLWGNVEKHSGKKWATNDVKIWRIRVACWISKATCTFAHAHAHQPGYPHAHTHAYACTHRPICDTYCFSTATMVSWTRLNVTLWIHCLSCFIYNMLPRESDFYVPKQVIKIMGRVSMNVILRRVPVTIVAVEKKEVWHNMSGCLWPYFSGMQRACAVLCCHLWHVWINHILSHYFTKGTIFGKKFLNINCVLWFPLRLSSAVFLILRRIKRHIFINVHTSSSKVLFSSDFNETRIVSTDFRKILKYQIS